MACVTILDVPVVAPTLFPMERYEARRAIYKSRLACGAVEFW